MPTNDFKALALGGSNRAATQANYLANSDLLNNGFPTGVVDSLMFNKAFRQSTFIAAVIGQIINDQAGIDALDDGVIANLETGLLRALRRFSTNGMYGVDTGSGANVYQVPYSPAVSAVIDGEVFKFRASHANTGASTFTPNPGTIATAPIWGADHAALAGGEIVLNGDVWVQWNSALNGGNGAWVLVDSTGGLIKMPTAAQFDNSNNGATTGFVQRALGNFSGRTTYTANTVLSAAAVGQSVAVTGNSVATLPALSTVPLGAAILFTGNGGITPSAGDTLSSINGTTLTNYPIGDSLNGYSSSLLVVKASNTVWQIQGGGGELKGDIAMFGSSLLTSGYQKQPSGLIIQWGSVTATTTGAAVTFPLAFPTQTLSVILGTANGNSVGAVSSGSIGLTGFSAFSASGSVGGQWVAFGK